MRTLSLVTETKCIRHVVIDGTLSEPRLEQNALGRLALSNNIDSGAGLMTLYKTLCSLIEFDKPQQVVILQAGNARFGNASPIRIKVEAMIQMASEHCHVPCQLLKAQTLRTKEKKFVDTVGHTAEVAFNAGADFTPQIMRDTVLTGWTQLSK